MEPLPEQRRRRLHLRVSERRFECVEVVIGHADGRRPRNGLPVPHGVIDPRQNALRFDLRHTEGARLRDHRLNRVDWAVVLVQPQFQLGVLVREWIDIEGRGEPPLAVRDVQEAVILDVVVNVGE